MGGTSHRCCHTPAWRRSGPGISTHSVKNNTVSQSAYTIFRVFKLHTLDIPNRWPSHKLKRSMYVHVDIGALRLPLRIAIDDGSSFEAFREIPHDLQSRHPRLLGNL